MDSPATTQTGAAEDEQGTYLLADGRNFASVAAVIEYVKSIDEQSRYLVQAELLDHMSKYYNRTGDMIEEVYEYIRGSKDYRLHISEEEFQDSWHAVEQIVEANKVRRKRHEVSGATVLRLWDSAEVAAWVEETAPSGNLLEMVRRAAKSMDFQSAVLRVNRAVVERLAVPKRGVSNRKEVATADWARALGVHETVAPLSTAELQANGLRIGRWGFVEEGAAPAAIDFAVATIDSPSPGADTADLALPEGEIEPAQPAPPAAPQAQPEECGRLLRQLKRTVLEDDSDFDSSSGGEASEAEGDSEYEQHGAKRRRLGGSDCGCSQDVAEAWRALAVSKKNLGLATDLKLLGTWADYERVCYTHTKALGSHVGLMLKKLKWEELEERLRYIHDNRLRIGTLKSDAETYRWFRRMNRPARPSDALGPYKFRHISPTGPYTFDQDLILASIGDGIRGTWERDGTVNVDIFGWWFEGEVGGVTLREFDMYKHHLRRINGKENYGWLRNMFYSLSQQLMRQDPLYYALYAALRPDKQWRLIAYPYYAKYAVKGDSTQFRHIDLNVPQMLSTGRGTAMIQGSVSLDDEDDTNCTMVLPGFQHKLGEWWNRMCSRGQDSGGYVHRISPQMFTQEDAAALGVDWTAVPCRRGEVRVTLPHIPHGANGPSSGTRRTMLPWFVGVQDDLESLEVIEGGSWTDLAQAHRDLTSPTATPSGLANRYGAIPYRFPAAVELTGLGALSDALVGRRRWDSPQVLAERDVMLGPDRQAAQRYVNEWRVRATRQLLEAFRAVVAAEKAAFGGRSFFYRQDTSGSGCGPLEDSASDSESASGSDSDSEERGFDFAEEGEAVL